MKTKVELKLSSFSFLHLTIEIIEPQKSSSILFLFFSIHFLQETLKRNAIVDSQNEARVKLLNKKLFLQLQGKHIDTGGNERINTPMVFLISHKNVIA